MLTRKMIIGMILAVLISMSTTAWGTIYYVDPNGDDSNGLSWPTAFNYLRDALDAVSSGDEIWVAKGTYYPDEGDTPTNDDRTESFQLVDSVGIYGGFDATETARSQRYWVNNVTILTGDIDKNGILDSNNSYNVVYSEDCDTDTVLDGFTITHGYANGGSSPYHRGGGMYNVESSPTVTNCIFTGNYALGGGGMHNDTYADTVVTNCTFVANSAVGLGGAMVNDNANATVKNCLFLQNSVSSSTTSYGGAIANFGDAPELINCTFVGNVARGGDDGYGGALFSSWETSFTVVNCIFWGNWATTYGTEILSAGVTTISYCDIEGGFECPWVCGNITHGGGNISTDPCFINIFDFSDITDDYGPPNTIKVKNTSRYKVGDEIEYDNDGTPREVTAVYTSYIKFEYDPLSSNSVAGKVVFNWGIGATDVDEEIHLDWDSNCIDAGDPNGDYDGESDIDGQPRVMVTEVDIGGDEAAYMPTCHPDYNEWVAVGKPACWCYQRQCHGDADGVLEGNPKGGYFYVGAGDLNVLTAAWLVKEPPDGPGIGSVENGICADFDHEQEGNPKSGYWRVGINDLNILTEYWKILEPPDGNGVDPNCLECE